MNTALASERSCPQLHGCPPGLQALRAAAGQWQGGGSTKRLLTAGRLGLSAGGQFRLRAAAAPPHSGGAGRRPTAPQPLCGMAWGGAAWQYIGTHNGCMDIPQQQHDWARNQRPIHVGCYGPRWEYQGRTTPAHPFTCKVAHDFGGQQRKEVAGRDVAPYGHGHQDAWVEIGALRRLNTREAEPRRHSVAWFPGTLPTARRSQDDANGQPDGQSVAQPHRAGCRTPPVTDRYW